jgi:hypothetical protein
VIALHITNRHLDLLPVARGLAAAFDLKLLFNSYRTGGAGWWQSMADWVLLTKNEEWLKTPELRLGAKSIETSSEPLLWTDDRTSVFRIVKWTGR